MRISEFARALGISADSVRRLEERGVLTGTRDWVGHRRFSEVDVARARAALFKHPEGGGPAAAPCGRRRRESRR